MVLCTVHVCHVPPDEVKLIESDKKLRMHPVMILLPIGEELSSCRAQKSILFAENVLEG